MDDQVGVSQSSFQTLPPLTVLYFDSSVFIAHIKGEPTACPDGSTRIETTTHLLEDAKNKKRTIFTSFITLAEVRRIRRRDVQLTEDERQRINQFFAEFLEHEWIQTIEVNREIAEHAQELGARYGIDAMDSIHLASAHWKGCQALFVWDKELSKHLPATVGGVRIMEPCWEGMSPWETKRSSTAP